MLLVWGHVKENHLPDPLHARTHTQRVFAYEWSHTTRCGRRTGREGRPTVWDSGKDSSQKLTDGVGSKNPFGQGEWDSRHCPNALPILCLEYRLWSAIIPSSLAKHMTSSPLRISSRSWLRPRRACQGGALPADWPASLAYPLGASGIWPNPCVGQLNRLRGAACEFVQLREHLS